MHTPYARKDREPRRSRWITASGFRLIPVLPVEINAHRFRHHVARECRQDRLTLAGRRFAMKLRRLKSARR